MHRQTTMLATLLLAVGSAAPIVAQGAGKTDTDRPVTKQAAVPDGWSVRPDGDGKAENVQFVSMGKGYHVTLGPATLLYRASDGGRGPVHAVATFTQTKSPGHPEGYGLFYGGKELTAAGQQYTYFLVRGDGKYLIKRRDGDKTTEITPWTAHPAIKSADAKGKATNQLEIDAKRDPAKIAFLANGQVVHSMDVKSGDVDGVMGIRANHGLDLHIEGFGVHR